MAPLLPDLKILQWNARSINSNKSSLEQLVCDYGVDICLISETWLKQNDHFSLQNFNVFRKDRLDRAGGGVAVLVHKKFKTYIQISFPVLPVEIEVCGVNIQFNNSIISFISIYNPPNFFTNTDTWNNLLNNCNNLLVLGGDFNAHHQCWGDSYSNKMGSIIIDMANDNNLVSLNTGSPTCFKFNPPSVTDITFVR